MGLCFSKQDAIINTAAAEVLPKRIVELQDIVKDSAWKAYNNCRPATFPKELKKVRVDYDWNDVKFLPEEPEYFDDKKTIAQDKYKILFESVFKNNSNKEQSHTLKTEQHTTATCKSSLTKGYNTGFNAGLTLAAPTGVVGANAGFSKGFSIENVLQTEDQRTMTWTGEGVLLVERESILTAKLQITERKTSYNFKTRVAVIGGVVVRFYKGKSTKLLMEYRANMRNILYQNRDKFTDENEDSLVEDIEGIIYLKIEGTCIFKYGIKQEIIINQTGKDKQQDEKKTLNS